MRVVKSKGGEREGGERYGAEREGGKREGCGSGHTIPASITIIPF